MRFINIGSIIVFRTLVTVISFFLFAGICFSNVAYYSKPGATDFNDVNSWGTNFDGSGSSPLSITTDDNYLIVNGSILSLTGNASVQRLDINNGTLNVAAHTLLIELVGQNNSEFNISINGTLIVSGGTINVNGSVYFANGATFNQTGGLLSVDGNSGVKATSVGSLGSNVPIFGIGYTAGGNSYPIVSAANAAKFTFTGGTIQIVDPIAGNGQLATSIAYNGTSAGINSGPGHTIEIGNGTVTNNGGTDNGYLIDLYVNGPRWNIGNLVINTVSTTLHRHVLLKFPHAVLGNLTIHTGSELRGGIAVAGNIVNNGTLTASETLQLQSFTGIWGSNNIPSNVAQTISGSGVFRNSTTLTTASFTSILINNSSPAGVTFLPPTLALTGSATGTVSNNLAFFSGKINTSGQTFILGSSISSNGNISTATGGFTSGSVFSRYWGTTVSGSAVVAGADPSALPGRYPFVTNVGTDRSVYVERAGGTVGGTISVQYNEDAGSTPVSFTDGAYTVNTRSKDNWVVSGNTPATSYELAIVAPGVFSVPDNTTRIVLASSVIGSYQLGTIKPCGQRILTPANFANTYYLGNSNIILPVIIMSFDARAFNEKSVNLVWNVTDEINVKEYIVERSNDNRNWFVVGSVNASKKATYTFDDNNPLKGINYYRLKVKDVNASTSFSEVRSVNFAGTGNLIVYPNPANSRLYINGNDDKNVVVSIYNEVGQVVNTLNTNGTSIASGIDVSQLLPGAYSIQIKGEASINTLRFVKQ